MSVKFRKIGRPFFFEGHILVPRRVPKDRNCEFCSLLKYNLDCVFSCLPEERPDRKSVAFIGKRAKKQRRWK